MTSKPQMIFIDTNIFIALEDEHDSTRDRAEQLLDEIERMSVKLVTSSYVISETLTVLAMKLGKSAARKFYQTILEGDIEEIFVHEKFHEEAKELFLSVPFKNISFIDCSNVVLMKHYGIDTIFSFDQDFKKLGVRLLSERR